MKKLHSNVSTEWVQSQKRSFNVTALFWIRRWRSGLLRITEKILNGPSISNLTIQDISSLSRNMKAMKYVRSIELLEKSELIWRNFQEPGKRFPSFQDFRRAIFRYRISEVHAHTESGVMIICGGFIVEEFFFAGSSGIYGAGTILHEYVEAKKAKFRILGTWVLLPLPRFYFHFIAQELPSIIRSSQEASVEGILTSNSIPGWAKEAIERIGIPVRYLSQESVIIQEVVCTSIPQVTSKSDVELLRHYYPPKSQINTDLAFIGRSGRHRNIGKLENTLIEFVLSNLGVIIEPEDFTWQEEIDFFNGCRKLILVYGSASANAVWMRPGSKVLILGDFSRFSAQIEKSLLNASEVDYQEFDISGIDEITTELNKVLNDFLNS